MFRFSEVKEASPTHDTEAVVEDLKILDFRDTDKMIEIVQMQKPLMKSLQT